jgi:methylated-DNA-[protein]-cysteine S-methyltransferase
MPKPRRAATAPKPPPAYQAAVNGLGFSVGVVCNDEEVIALHYLPPQAARAPDNPLAAEAMRQIAAYFADPRFEFALPLRPTGTTFQRRVREEIARIPSGETRSYGEVARAIHSGPRAVGGACGANPFPLAIPCHRVVAAGGALGGFGGQDEANGDWLIAVKRRLLAHERR